MSEQNAGDLEPKNPGAQTLSPPAEPAAPQAAGAPAPDAPPADAAPSDAPQPAARPAESVSALPAKLAPSATVFPLGERLHKLGRHPVMLFGTTSSGKSTILMSFIANLMHNPDVSIKLGEPIYPSTNPMRQVEMEFAQDFFERRTEKFLHDKEVLTTTLTPSPLFIPIDIQRTRDETPTKFAFLEGQGEWYERSNQPKGTMYQDFRAEVADVLKFYDANLSAVFVAPCSSLDNEKRMRDNDIGLMGALNAYQRYRSRQDEDSLLFLMTKWDVYANPLTNSRFGQLEPSDVSQVLDRQYPDSWRAFQAMPRPLRNDRRFFMQYCAGYLVDEANHAPPAKQKDVFERYPRTLLNWLYGNATRTVSANGRTSRERILFNDVVSPDAVRVRYIDRVTNFILAR